MDATVPAAPARPVRTWVLRAIAAGTALLALLGIARLQLGPEPAPEAATEASSAPPLLLADGQDRDPALTAAAAELAAGNADAAATGFAELLSRDQSDTAAQAGLALSQWSDGPAASIRSLRDATTVDPSDPWPWLNLGLAQTIALGPDRGRTALERARDLGREADFAAARQADDLLHPTLAPGYPPLVLEPAEWKSQPTAGAVSAILAAVARDDRAAAAAAAAQLDDSSNRAAAVAAILGSYDKAEHTVSTGELARLARRGDTSDVAAFHLGLLLLWQGDRAGARELLQPVADSGGTRAVVAARLLGAADGSVVRAS